MENKGQLTIIIILGILFVMVILVAFFISQGNEFSLKSKKQEVRNIESLVEDCIQEQTTNAIWLIGMQGGYTSQPNEYIETPFATTAYGLKDGRNVLVSKQTMEQEIQNHLLITMPFCVDDAFSNFELSKEEPFAEVKIRSDDVLINAKYPMILYLNDTSYKSEKTYKIDIPIRLGNIHDLAQDIIERQKSEGDFIPVTFLSQFDTEIIFEYHNDNTIYYIIHDKESQVNDITYNFLFAAELPISENE